MGGGISGSVDGRDAAVGSPAFIEEFGMPAPRWATDAIASAADRALTPLLVAMDGRVVAVAALGDAVRPDAYDAVSRLRTKGWDVRLLSGDHPRVVDAVATQLGLDPSKCRGGVTPEEKLNAVLTEALKGPVVMVGDGVNDAVALSAASVGIAVHGGAEASLAAADVYLNRPGLTPILELMTASRRTVRAIRACLAASLGYNALAAALAVSGQISPVLAAVLMPVSSFTVLALAWRVRTFDTRGGAVCR
jgi:Cu2+-exporting ATPase